jgi:hypothetical protein
MHPPGRPEDLEHGDIPTAWAYYRAIAETDRVAQAILAYRPAENDDRLGAIIEVAFNHGVSPRRGFELILDHYGTCSAITAFEQLPEHDESVRDECAERLISQLHRDLSANRPRSRVASAVPPVGAAIAADPRPRLALCR